MRYSRQDATTERSSPGMTKFGNTHITLRMAFSTSVSINARTRELDNRFKSGHQSLGDHHEHIFECRLLFGEGDQAAVGGHQLAQQALNVGFFAVHFERAAAGVHVDIADLRVAADQAHAGFRVSGESDFNVAVALDLPVDRFNWAV